MGYVAVGLDRFSSGRRGRLKQGNNLVASLPAFGRAVERSASEAEGPLCPKPVPFRSGWFGASEPVAGYNQFRHPVPRYAATDCRARMSKVSSAPEECAGNSNLSGSPFPATARSSHDNTGIRQGETDPGSNGGLTEMPASRELRQLRSCGQFGGRHLESQLPAPKGCLP